jgi:hypothetical protein
MDRFFQRPPGYALHGDANLIPDERNDGDVSVDERFPFNALAQTGLWLQKLRSPVWSSRGTLAQFWIVHSLVIIEETDIQYPAVEKPVL